MSLLMIPFYFTNPSYRHFLSVCSMCFQELGPSGPAQAEPPPSPELASLCVRWAPRRGRGFSGGVLHRSPHGDACSRRRCLAQPRSTELEPTLWMVPRALERGPAVQMDRTQAESWEPLLYGLREGKDTKEDAFSQNTFSQRWDSITGVTEDRRSRPLCVGLWQVPRGGQAKKATGLSPRVSSHMSPLRGATTACSPKSDTQLAYFSVLNG